MAKFYFVVFNNDTALCVCEDRVQAGREIARRKEAWREEVMKSHPPGWYRDAAIDRAYFHWHEVPAAD